VGSIRSECAEFLRRFTIEAYYEEGFDRSGRKLDEMTSHVDGSLLQTVERIYRGSEEWKEFERELRAVAQEQAKAQNSTGPPESQTTSTPPEPSTPSSPPDPVADKAQRVIAAAQIAREAAAAETAAVPALASSTPSDTAKTQRSSAPEMRPPAREVAGPIAKKRTRPKGTFQPVDKSTPAERAERRQNALTPFMKTLEIANVNELVDRINEERRTPRAPSSIYDYWNGETKRPTPGLRSEIAKALRIAPEKVPK
jgi:hypothetical protein